MRALSNTGGAGSSGHVITDGTTNFEDREFLQFNDVDIQDDSVNNKTIIKPQFRTVTETEWNLMSPAERDNPNVYWVRPWMSSNEYSSDMSPVGTVISVSCAKTEDGATDSQGDPIYTPSGIYPPESDYLVCDGAPVYINQYPKLAEYFERAYGTKFYFNAGQLDPQDGTFAIPDWSADFPENGVLCIKAQISSTAITYAEIDQSGIYAGEDKVPSCARVAEIESDVEEIKNTYGELITLDNIANSNINGNIRVVGNIGLLYISAPKNAMTYDTAYNAGTMPVAPTDAISNQLFTLNNREYAISFASTGALTITCKTNTLPSGGKPFLNGYVMFGIST